MKKWFLFLFPFILFAKTIIVYQGATPCESGDEYVKSISDAIKKSENGDKIKICPGLYNEKKLNVDKSLEFIGLGSKNSDVEIRSKRNVFYINDGVKVIFYNIDINSTYWSSRAITFDGIDSLKLDKVLLAGGTSSIDQRSDKHIGYLELIRSNIVRGQIYIRGSANEVRIENSKINRIVYFNNPSKYINNLYISDSNFSTNSFCVRIKQSVGNEEINNSICVSKDGGLENYGNIDTHLLIYNSNFVLSKNIGSGIDFEERINAEDANISKVFIRGGATGIIIKNFSKINLEDVNITKSGNGIVFKSGNNVNLNKLNIEASTSCIEVDRAIYNSFNVLNMKCNGIDGGMASNEGIVFYSDVSNFKIKDSIIKANNGIYTRGNIYGDNIIDNVFLNANDYGCEFSKDKTINNLYIQNSTIISQNRKGIYITSTMDNFLLKNVFIKSKEESVYLNRDVNKDFNVTDVNITSYSSGILINRNIYGKLNIKNSNINSNKAGIDLEGNNLNPNIVNCKIFSNDDNAVYLGSNDYVSFVLKDSCLETNESKKYAIYLDVNSLSSASIITNNCFYALDDKYLGYAKGSDAGNKFDGNYWDRYIGDSYTLNNINDQNVLFYCKNNCPTHYYTIADYRMDECMWKGENKEVKDNSLLKYHITAYGSAQTELNSSVGGGICKVGSFNGIDSKLLGDFNFSFKNTFTITLWFNTSDIQKSYARMIEFSKGGNYKKSTAIAFDNGGKIIRGWTNQNGRRSKEVAYDLYSNGYLDGKWHFLAYTYDGKKERLYLDGTLVNEVEDNSITQITIPDTIVIGGYALKNSYMYKGYLDEVKIFPQPLNSEDIKNIFKNEQAKKNWDGSRRYCKCPIPLMNYRMDECKWNGKVGEVEDSSPNKYNGTAENGATTEFNSSVGGGICKVGSFNGNNDIDIPYNIKLSHEVTYSVWIKRKNVNYVGNKDRIENIFTNQAYFNAVRLTEKGYYYYGDKGNRILFQLRINGKDKILFSNKKIDDTKWHHIVAMYDGKYMKIYIDGKEDASDYIFLNGTIDNGSAHNKIASEYGGYYFYGYIDEVKVWDKALDPEFIDYMYNNEKNKKNWDGSKRNCKCVLPKVEYRMDECYWGGIEGEVKDSSENSINATAERGANTESNSTAGGGICMVGKFSGSNYINAGDVLNDVFGTSSKEFTITLWLKPVKLTTNSTNHKTKNTFIAKASDDYNDNLEIGVNPDGSIHLYLDTKKRDKYADIGSGVDINKWHFIAVRYKEGTVDVFIDDKKYTDTTTWAGASYLDKAEGSLFTIGASLHVDNFFTGYIDEVKVFPKAILDKRIEEIYNNEKNKKNWDGTSRECKECKCNEFLGVIVPLEMETGRVTLDQSTNKNVWTHVIFKKPFSEPPVVFSVATNNGGNSASIRFKNITKYGFDVVVTEPSGNDGPHVSQTIDFIAINKGVHKLGDHYVEVGTITTNKVQGKYLDPKINNIGWEKINTQVSFCNPTVLANIQTINNEQNNIPEKPSVPWMTAVVETNVSGIYLSIDASETISGYPLKSPEIIGYMIAEGNFKDSFDNNGALITYETIKTGPYFVGWNNQCKTVKFLNSYINNPIVVGWKNSRIESDGGWFRRCYLDKEKVGFKVDEDEYYDSERKHVEEKGGIFAFCCSFHYGEASVEIIPEFNAVSNIGDDGVCVASDDWDNNISMQIAKKAFKLYILSRDKGTLKNIEANITKVSFSYYSSISGNLCSGDKIYEKNICENCGETNISGCLEKDVIVNKAARCIRVYIRGRSLESNTSGENNSTDAFSVRPKEIVIDMPLKIISGDNFDFNLSANDNSNNSTIDYNNTLDVNVTISDSYKICPSNTAEFNISKVIFKNGKSINIAKFNDIGEVNISIKDTNWTEVDRNNNGCKECFYNDDCCYLEGNKTNVKIVPHHFELNLTLLNFDNNFTYIDTNNTHIYGFIDYTIVPKNEENQTTLNYNKECYAKNIDTNISYRFYVNDKEVNRDVKKLNYTYTNVDTNITDVVNVKEAIKLKLSKDNFIFKDNNVSAKIKIYFNFEKNISNPVSPFEFNLTDVNISDGDVDRKEVNISKNVTFYYGNLITNDYLTKKNKLTVVSTFVVYDSDDTNLTPSNGKEILVNWFENLYHNNKDGNLSKDEIKVSNSYEYNSSKVVSGINIDSVNVDHQKLVIQITKNSDINFIVLHLISPNLAHLWYSKFGEEYNISDGSSCLNHFCIGIKWEHNKKIYDVGSGDFNGTEANITESNSTSTGVKIFR